MTARVVLLGGGYVTVWAYRALCRRLGRKQPEVAIIVVCPENFHAYHGWTGAVLCGIVTPPNMLSPLRSLLPRAEVLRGEAVRVDLGQGLVYVRPTGESNLLAVHYDHLLIGTGSRDRLEGVPGLAAHGWQLKRAADMLALRSQLIGVLERAEAAADPAQRLRLLTVVVAGGGFAGVEMMAAIAELLQTARRRYPVLQRHQPRLVLLHTGPALLPQLRPRFARLADYATAQLYRHGVDVRCGVGLAACESWGARLSDGGAIAAATVISTVGQARLPLPGTEGLPRAADGRLLTDATLRVARPPPVWAGGDTAQVLHPASGAPGPATALWALKHGERAGDNIARALCHGPLRPFRYPGLGQAASLGTGRGAVELYGRQFTGWPAWLMRLGFFLYFMPARRQAVRVLADWLLLPWLGRQLVTPDPPAGAR